MVHGKSADGEEAVNELMKKYAKKYRVKSRNYTDKGMDFVYEIIIKYVIELTKALEEEESVERFSLMEYEVDDVL